MKYSEISKEHRALEKMDRHETTDALANDDKFWTAHEAFKVRLKHALRDEECMRKMKPQFIQFVAWCTSFRPNEPHVILTCLARLAN